MSLELTITDEDFDAKALSTVRAVQKGKKVLGGDSNEERDQIQRALLDALPAAVARRLKRITPPDFVVAEVQMKLSLGGKICGIGVDGDVNVKFAPRK